MYGFDDDLIISGANLSADYFNQRQDRYMIFRSASALTDYFAALVALSSAFCYGLIGRDASSTLAAFDLTWPHADLERPEKKHRAFRETVSQRLNEFTTNFAQFLSPRETPGDDTTISPVLQMGSFGIHQETDTVMPALFECAHALDPAIASLSFTSGYFNMTPQMTRQLLACPIPSSVVCASPQANGFYGSQGFSRHIPAGYTEAEKRFYLQAHSSAAAQVTLSEYARQGWTYHAKGLWLHTDNVGPGTTYIGSSNYGPRSARRDVEANLLITTKSDEFKGRLKDEIKQIETYTQPVDAQTFEAPDRKVTMGVSIAARLIKDML
ncbi:hypothetical protein E5Q_03035 [Mixia osmundae IAM 14324]|nr:hypothetical protein E5Q_03035 [Mixia osmundae IAM 14324]